MHPHATNPESPPPAISRTHLLLIPSYNTGAQLLLRTIRSALAHWTPVWVIIDGSTDASHLPALELAQTPGHRERLRVIHHEKNTGKGAAVHAAAETALAAGYTHALVMDADGQHPADHIPAFMRASQAAPDALILGAPIFGPEAPLVRLKGRKLSIALVHLETLSRAAIADPLFGYRVYPLAPLAAEMRRTRYARRYDFDPEIAVRLYWAGVRPINHPAPCKYLTPAEGAVSHFRYLRDNLRMIWLHTRLLTMLLLHKWPAALRARKKHKTSKTPTTP